MSTSNEHNERSDDIEEGRTSTPFGSSSSPNTYHNLNEATSDVSAAVIDNNRSPSSTTITAAAGTEVDANIPVAAAVLRAE